MLGLIEVFMQFGWSFLNIQAFEGLQNNTKQREYFAYYWIWLCSPGMFQNQYLGVPTHFALSIICEQSLENAKSVWMLQNIVKSSQ